MAAVARCRRAPFSPSFFTTPGCRGAPVFGVDIPAGQARATAYFMGSTPSTYTVTAASSGLTPATQQAIVGADTLVALTSMVPGGVRFYRDSSCTTQASSVTILGGQSSTTFSMKPLTGGPATITATATFGSASQSFDVLPIVRRGSCTITSSQGRCVFSPTVQDTNQALLFTQAVRPSGRATRPRRKSATSRRRFS